MLSESCVAGSRDFANMNSNWVKRLEKDIFKIHSVQKVHPNHRAFCGCSTLLTSLRELFFDFRGLWQNWVASRRIGRPGCDWSKIDGDCHWTDRQLKRGESSSHQDTFSPPCVFLPGYVREIRNGRRGAVAADTPLLPRSVPFTGIKDVATILLCFYIHLARRKKLVLKYTLTY